MSLLNWFSKKPQPQESLPEDSSGLGSADATVPFKSTDRGGARSAAGHPANVSSRRSARLERRDLLYAVVREAMIRAGMLSSSYKFKVLSLDSSGRQYLIMMDIARDHAADTARLADIEGSIARHAKERHDILVSAVYWRVNEYVTAASGRLGTPASSVVRAASPSPASSTATAMGSTRGGYEPLAAEEVAAFKQALASATPAPALSGSGEIIKSGRRNPEPMPSFADTEIDDRPSPLGATQYGDL